MNLGLVSDAPAFYDKPKDRPRVDESPPIPHVGTIRHHFLDSGSFTLWTKAAEYAKQTGKGKWSFYSTKQFWRYMDAYAEFIKRHHKAIHQYANVDVIPNPELSWRNQRYLERVHGLDPVPVVHYGTDLKWLRHYLEREYAIIGFGGLVGSMRQESCRAWIDRCFNMVCEGDDHLPQTKIHGFGIVSHYLMWRYPWYSVDASGWMGRGAMGRVIFPPYRHRQFRFDLTPHDKVVSVDAPERASNRGRHFFSWSRAEQKVLERWLKHIRMPLGKIDRDGKIVEFGVTTRHSERKQANVIYLELMCQAMPEWPWPFISKRKKGFGLVAVS